MAEIKREVKTYEVRYLCDKCDEGEMLPTGLYLSSIPPQYPHVCNECGDKKTFIGKSYPIISYEHID